MQSKPQTNSQTVAVRNLEFPGDISRIPSAGFHQRLEIDHVVLDDSDRMWWALQPVDGTVDDQPSLIHDAPSTTHGISKHQ